MGHIHTCDAGVCTRRYSVGEALIHLAGYAQETRTCPRFVRLRAEQALRARLMSVRRSARSTRNISGEALG